LGATSEAMINGCIPIVSDRGGLPEAVPLKELVVDVENPNILADKIKEIMENSTKQRKIRKTFKDWLKKFSIETAAKQFLSFYEEAIRKFKKKK
jgi:glycosyltransferase involved in cell wall biosynthesis